MDTLTVDRRPMYYEERGDDRVPAYHFLIVDHAADVYAECSGPLDDFRTVKVEALEGTSDEDRLAKADAIARLYGAVFVGVRHGDRWEMA